MEDLITGDFKSNADLLKWFNGFYSTGAKSEEYDPVKARHDSDISPLLQQAGKKPDSSENITVRGSTYGLLLF